MKQRRAACALLRLPARPPPPANRCRTRSARKYSRVYSLTGRLIARDPRARCVSSGVFAGEYSALLCMSNF
jgi:hypothetical protein